MENRIVLAGIMVTAVTMLVMIGMATATINLQMAYARHWSHGWGAGRALSTFPEVIDGSTCQ